MAAQRSELQIVRDRNRLASMALRNPGASSTDLAAMFQEEYGVSLAPRTIRYDLQQLKKQWLLETREDMQLVRSHELRRIDVFEQEAWNAWRASMRPMHKEVVERLHKEVNDAARRRLASQMAGELADESDYVTEEVIEAIIRDAIEASLDSGESAETFVNKITTTVEERVGDPRYLTHIHNAQAERRKILGVYAPELHQLQVQKIELKGYTGGWSPDNWKDDDIIDGEYSDGAEKDRLGLVSGDG